MAFVPVTFSEYQSDGPHESVGEDGVFRATRKVICPYSRRHDLIDYLWGTEYPYAPETSATMRNVSDISPVTAEVLAGFTEQYLLRDNEQKPFQPEVIAAQGSLAVYEAAILTLQYHNKIETASDEPGHNPRFGPGITKASPVGDLFTEEFTPAANFETLSPENLGFSTTFSGSGSGVPSGTSEIRRTTADETLPVLILGGTYTLTWYRVRLVKSEVLTLAGTCNKDAVATKKFGFVFPPQTLLYQAAPLSPGNRDLFTVSLRFEYKAAPDLGGVLKGWNYFWRSDRQSFDRVWTVPAFGSGDTPVQVIPYKPKAFEPLLDFEELQEPLGAFDGFATILPDL